MSFERVFVWLGGAAFIVSLAVCAAAYGIAWSDPGAIDGYAAAQTAGAIVINLLLFTLFAAHHSLFARDPVKTWLARQVPERLLRSVYVWIASGLFVVVIMFWQPIGGFVYDHTGWKAALHTGVQLAGVWLIARSVRAIDALELAGIRRAGPADGLQIVGPYQFVRHPLYLGWILVVSGAARMTGDRLVFAVITSTYLVLAIPWEERALERTFGPAYRQYKRDVRWRVLPYVY